MSRGPLEARRKPVEARRGTTLVEVAIVAALLTLVVASIGQAIASMHKAETVVATRTRLQQEAIVALEHVLDDLRLSGFVNANGASYPTLFTGGAPPPAFAAHAHPPAVEHAAPGEPDFGPDRELIFALPADADGDGRPDLDANGDLVWDARSFSYVLVTGPDGVNQLQRRIDNAQPRAVADHVERVLFDDATTTGFALPLDSVRVRLWLRMPDDEGIVHRHFIEGLVRLRNGIQAQVILSGGP